MVRRRGPPRPTPAGPVAAPGRSLRLHSRRSRCRPRRHAIAAHITAQLMVGPRPVVRQQPGGLVAPPDAVHPWQLTRPVRSWCASVEDSPSACLFLAASARFDPRDRVLRVTLSTSQGSRRQEPGTCSRADTPGRRSRSRSRPMDGRRRRCRRTASTRRRGVRPAAGATLPYTTAPLR